MNLRQINTADGLTNSAVLSLYSGSDGLLWAGTCDGLNLCDGYAVYPTRQMPEFSSITGNIIENITETAPGTLWVQTNHGLNRITTISNRIFFFPEYQGKEKLIVSPDRSLFVLTENCDLTYCRENDTQFTRLVNLQYDFADICDICIEKDKLRIFTKRGIIDYDLNKEKNGYSVGKPKQMSDRRLAYAFCDDDKTLAVDQQGNILLYKSRDTHPAVLYNISGEIRRRGQISDMLVDDNGNIFISFLTYGIIKLSQGDSGSYNMEDLGIDIGIFCLAKSPLQNLVWAGTDCHGVYTLYDDPYTVQFLGFNDFNSNISRPVRAIYLDQRDCLWLGTKGDGLLCVSDFKESNCKAHGDEKLYTTTNSKLSDNSIYALSRSNRPLLWIGTDNGINYYSYKDNTIHVVDTGGQPVNLVHGIYEANDTTLFISTTGDGVFKASISGPHDYPVLTDIRRYTINNGNVSSNYFFAQTIDNIDTPLFGNRGFGIFTLRRDSLINIYNLKNEYPDKSINDVFAVLSDNNTIWAGTGYGLLKMTSDDDKLYAGVENGFLNNTIHSMLKDEDGNLWISTNNGIVRFNPELEKGHNYMTNYSISANEFSDGAAYKSDNALIFGGVDGIVLISKASPTPPGENYLPAVSVVGLSIAGRNEPLHEYLFLDKSGNGKRHLVLNSNQNYFALNFSAPDFANPESYIFLYTLDGNKWISNGTNRQLTFTRLDYGNNTLKVKYRNRETGIESDEYHLDIKIKAPWYLSTLAQIVYFTIIITIVLIAVRIYYLRHNEKQKNEIYENKLKFFTNISHELLTPLTLIYGTSERMLAAENADPDTCKYVNLIRNNTEQLSSLIQSLIDFRKIETGNKAMFIRRIDVSTATTKIYESFTVIAEQNNISFTKDIPDNLYFNSDHEALLRIISNLVSNAFKYTPAEGSVKIGVRISGDNLVIEVYNTGNGISENDRKKIFNRYSILDNVEKKATQGLSSRNGLGLAICNSLVEMLGGHIDIDSEVGNYALFRVILPPKETTHMKAAVETDDDDTTALQAHTDDDRSPKLLMPTVGKANILVIDDNPGILKLLTDSLTEYNIITAMTAKEGLQMLKSYNIELIITDVMIPDNDGVSLTRNIRRNKHTMYIPIIILSALNSNSEKVKGLAAGADAYIGKPFQLSYLRAVIYRLLENQKTMKEYYNTSASAYGYVNGRLQDKESKDFIDKVISYIDANIENDSLNAESLAEHMQMGVRNLYRKFKEIGLNPPNEFIKSHKISFAAKLLVTTSLTVQEIIYRSGFNNRSHFYREFFRQFNTTPKDYRTKNKDKSDFASPE